MGAEDGSIKVQFALRYMALRALVVANLRQVYMLVAGREIHIIVAGAASSAIRFQESIGLLRSVRVTGFAIAHVRRKGDRGEINHTLAEADDLIGFACDDTGQAGSGMD